MKIARWEFNPNCSSLDVYVSGCRHHPCKGCHNPELWDFNYGTPWHEAKGLLFDKLINLGPAVKRVMVFGGEPLDQDAASLCALLYGCQALGKETWVFTGHDYALEPVSQYIDYLKTGRYVEELKTDANIQFGIKLASSNQRIWKL